MTFDTTSFRVSELITRDYSTSFYSATRMLDQEIQQAIFSIYGFVRFADEIVDTLHDYPQENLMQKFESDYYLAYQEGVSLNPILHSFQLTVKKYRIEDEHIRAFLKSMKDDLVQKDYTTTDEMNGYIYGSADVVGLMCLKVFCRGDELLYQQLEAPAMRLGSAFQKVNFLRDMGSDINQLGRRYFPDLVQGQFNEQIKAKIILDIVLDFKEAKKGIRHLPADARLAVSVAYYYYLGLLRKLKSTSARKIVRTRIRTSSLQKWMIFLKAMIYHKLGIV